MYVKTILPLSSENLRLLNPLTSYDKFLNPMKRLPFGFVLSIVTGISLCFSQSPGVRNGHNMVYHAPTQSIILFGGADEAKVYGDTWSLTNGKWKKLREDGPSPRTFPSMVMADGYILLFGGNSVLFGNDKNPVRHLDDTWKYQEGTWQKVDANLHPGARAEAAMGYDPVCKKVVLFGGRLVGEKWLAGDTWEFDGSKWSPMETAGPTPRSGAVMVYDAQVKQIILFGGNPVISKEKDYNGPMWSWDGHVWNSMNSKVPLVFNSCLAYSTDENFILRFGGWNGTQRNNDTWMFRHHDWEKLTPENSPPARNHSIMVYQQESKSFILFGGHDGDYVFGDIWEFKNGKWNLVIMVDPRMRLDNGH